MYREPPNIDVDKLDFSEFHPLDHKPWEPRCRELYGGWRIHLKYEWELRTGPRVEGWLGRVFCCWWGHHNPAQQWMRSKEAAFAQDETAWVTSQFCHWCYKRLTEWQPK